MDGYVSKPFSAQELFEAVERRVTVALASNTPGLPTPPKPSVTIDSKDLTDVLDWEAVKKRLHGRAESLAQAFLQEAPKLMTDIQAAIANGEADQLHRAAHTLKGSADIFAAKSVVQAAWEIECMGRDGQMEKAKAACEDLNRKIKQLMTALLKLSNVSHAV
jgi:HPt (histidine-containing phosphotransfer) domain-containing protein